MIGIVDYEAGNLYNVARAVRSLGARYVVSGDPAVLGQCGKIILPGVGSARTAMNSLARQGLLDFLRNLEIPFLGICLGLQLLFAASEEDDCPCLGLLPGTVRRFDSARVKVPHMGWNRVTWRADADGVPTGLLDGIPQEVFFYFVHSYRAPAETGATIGWSDYDGPFSAAVRIRNFIGVQFHPERSGESGLCLLRNFIESGSGWQKC